MIMQRTIFLLVIAAVCSAAHADGSGSGSHRPAKPPETKKTCAPVRTNTFSAILDVPATPPSVASQFDAYPLPPDMAKIGFVAKRADNTYIVIPNQLRTKQMGWLQLTRSSKGGTYICASRIIAVFEAESETPDVKPLFDLVKAANPNAKFVRPLMQSTQVEWTIPFVGVLNRFDPKPTFALGGLMVVWDLDAQNTAIVNRFIENAPDVNIPGVLMMREHYSGLRFSIALNLNGKKLLSSAQAVSVDP